MSEEEINNLLDIGCCIYHDKLCKKAHNYILEMQDKIDKAIEYIKENFDETGICVSGSDLPYSYIEELLEILGEKEDE